jgi:ribosomal-protein-alanine N-acetyltransferase
MSSPATSPYFLATQRLGFRCWTREDLSFARELWVDLEVTRYFGGPFSESDIEERFQREFSRLETYGFQYWPIFLLADNERVGCCGLRPYRPEQQMPELGFHLRPKFWGRGLAVEAARAVIAYAFGSLGAKSLSAGHHPQNLASKKVLEKLGFRFMYDEFFPTLGMDIPYYRLARPERESLSEGHKIRPANQAPHAS